ncbi:MAG TPA: ElyC/SanA/YdcF family protein [Longimicrobium sp.]|nr:ElyC/SanA/YdcF family protein [Longimicrobium sp.]
MRPREPVKQPGPTPAGRDAIAASGGSPAPRPKRRRGRRWLIVLSSLAAAGLLLWLLRAPILTAAAGYLSVHDPLQKADAIFVFGGDPDIRPYAAAELYHRGWAPRVLVPGMETGRLAADGLIPTQTQLFVGVLKKQGVPDTAVQVLNIPGGTTSTTDDARVLRDWVRRTHARRVIAVTTTYHTRRARLALLRAFDGMDVEVVMHGAPTRGYSERDWWKHETGLTTYFNEYLKLARYKLAGGAR